ncbi:MAG TPA: diaminopimelate epimerase [Mycobacteriales bacterium]|nr:diaminopimelate epimerase [Mycobacteriales bacterium]
MRFVKGHGTENDFVVLPDFEGDLDESLVRALCDRHAGIGADGVLRVLLTPDGYFMDYRNADGSIAETCGNGIRVFARYLVTAGLLPAGDLVIGTLSGPRAVTVPGDGGDITVDMGPATRLAGADITVGTSSWNALGWSMGNPHLVVLDAGPIDLLDLSSPPAVDPASAYPDGVNVELLEPVGERHVRMRVHERGVGETRSCGTGACAAAVAVMDETAERSTCIVDLPGGRLVVAWCEDGTVLMTGPAVLVAAGEVEPPVIQSPRR